MTDYFEEDTHKGQEPGVYRSTLVAIDMNVVVEPFKDPKSGTTDAGERWAFDWDIETDDGIVRMRQLTTRKLSDFPSKAWMVLTAFGYRGGRADPASFIGRACMITLGLKPNGWNTFDAFSPIRTKPLNTEVPFPDLKAPEGSAQAMIDRLAREKAQPPTVEDLPPLELDDLDGVA